MVNFIRFENFEILKIIKKIKKKNRIINYTLFYLKIQKKFLKNYHE